MSVEVVKSLIDNVDVGRKAFYLTLWMGIMDLERFMIFNTTCAGVLVKHLKEKGVEEPFMFSYAGRKENKGKRECHTFIGYDALAAWKEYFERKRGWPRDGEPIYLDADGKAVRKHGIRMRHLRLLERLKYIKRGGSTGNRHGFNLHEFRDTARTLLHLQGKKEGLDLEAVEFFMGHVTDPNQYDNFFKDKNYTLTQYRIAEKYLNIISGSAEVSQLQEEMQRRDEAVKKLTLKFEEATRRLEDLERKLTEKT